MHTSINQKLAPDQPYPTVESPAHTHTHTAHGHMDTKWPLLTRWHFALGKRANPARRDGGGLSFIDNHGQPWRFMAIGSGNAAPAGPGRQDLAAQRRAFQKTSEDTEMIEGLTILGTYSTDKGLTAAQNGLTKHIWNQTFLSKKPSGSERSCMEFYSIINRGILKGNN